MALVLLSTRQLAFIGSLAPPATTLASSCETLVSRDGITASFATSQPSLSDIAGRSSNGILLIYSTADHSAAPPVSFHHRLDHFISANDTMLRLLGYCGSVLCYSSDIACWSAYRSDCYCAPTMYSSLPLYS